MLKTLQRIHSLKIGYHSFQVLPRKIKLGLEITSADTCHKRNIKYAHRK